MAEVAVTSPYIYLATCFFALSAVSSDLLFIRCALTFGFLFLVLASISGHAKDGSFTYTPLSDGIIDITMWVNVILFLLNAFICVRLIHDESPHIQLNDEEMALFRFFQSRCGVTLLQMKEIIKHGSFLELPPKTEVPDCHSVLYLVLEGKVSCEAKFTGNMFGKSFFKRSGQFFDIKLFNLFSIPVGFDAKEFHAKTVTTTKLFYWTVDGLIAMREAQSPSLKPFWEYMVLRAMAGVAIQSHLKSTETQYDSLLVPEHKGWLEGAPSRDFWKREKDVGNWEHVKRQWGILRSSLWQIIPPSGVRHRPGIVAPHNPKQAYIELLCKAAASDKEAFRFLQDDQAKKKEKENKELKDEPVGFRFLQKNTPTTKQHPLDVESGIQK